MHLGLKKRPHSGVFSTLKSLVCQKLIHLELVIPALCGDPDARTWAGMTKETGTKAEPMRMSFGNNQLDRRTFI